MPKSPLEVLNEFLLTILEKYPNPPRPVRFLDILSFVLRVRQVLIITIAGTAALAIGVGGIAGVLSDARFHTSPLAYVVPVILGSSALIVPVLLAIAFYNRAKFGVVTQAKVISVKFGVPMFTNDLEAIFSGVATGVLAMSVNGQVVEQKFRITLPWAKLIRVGSVIQVLTAQKGLVLPLKLLEG